MFLEAIYLYLCLFPYTFVYEDLSYRNSLNVKMSAATNDAKVILRKPRDWDSWSNAFKSRAVAADFWQYIDPTADPKPAYTAKPQLPDPTKYDKRAVRLGAATRGSAAATGPQVREEEAIDPEGRPQNMGEMTSASRAAFQGDLTLYQIRQKLYEAERKAEKDLKQYIEETVAAEIYRIACEPEQPIATWFSNLKQQAGLSDRQEKAEIRDQYLEVIKPLTKAPKDPEKWATQWEATLALAKAKQVEGAQQPTSWFLDLLKATAAWLPEWTLAFRLAKETAVFEGECSYREVANDLRKAIQTALQQRKPKVGKGAFPAFAGQEAPELQNNEDKESDPKGHKRTRSEGKKLACPACNKPHRLEKCYYVFPQLAPRGFRLAKKTQDEVAEKLQEDDQLREEVEKLKGKKQKQKGGQAEQED